MNKNRELKDAYIGAQVSRQQKQYLQKWCQKRDTTPSRWIRNQIENLESKGTPAYA